MNNHCYRVSCAVIALVLPLLGAGNARALQKDEKNVNSVNTNAEQIRSQNQVPEQGSSDVSILSADRQSVRRDTVRTLHVSMQRGDFESAALLNSILAKEAFRRAYWTLKAWENERDPETGLVPKATGEKMAFWNTKDTAADLYPFLLLASHYLDKENEPRWLSMIEQERSICGEMPCTIFFRPARVAEEDTSAVIFGASEYAKDGLLAVAERLGRGPWFDRLEEIAQSLIGSCYIPTSSGKICSSNTEVNGEMLQVLTRLYWATQREEYLQMAERIGEAYLFEILPKNKHLPVSNWDFSEGKGSSTSFRFLDHGSEIIPGLVELYVLEKVKGRPQAVRYRHPLKELLDTILKAGRTEDGLWFGQIDVNTFEPISERVVDTWGYLLNAYQMFDLVEGSSVYLSEIQKVMRAVAARKSFNWQPILAQGATQDGYADSIESMLYLLPWFDIPECHFWVDDEMEILFHMQKPSGFVDKVYLDGNFIRTALLYGTYKTMGIIAEPWHEDLRLGAAYDNHRNELFIYLSSDKPWEGVLKFDLPRHRTIWGLPFEYPRLNEAPEWFVVEPDKQYSIVGLEKGKTFSYSGKLLAKGLPVAIDKEHSSFHLKVSEQ